MRKRTTPVHVAGGILAGYSLWLNAAVGLAMVVSFGAFEFWQEHKVSDTGALDFLEFVIGLFIGAGIGCATTVIIMLLV